MEEGADDWGLAEDLEVIKKPKRRRRKRALADGLPWSDESVGLLPVEDQGEDGEDRPEPDA
eukprot:9108041-Pyramimonas_sp.AAC.1